MCRIERQNFRTRPTPHLATLRNPAAAKDKSQRHSMATPGHCLLPGQNGDAGEGNRDHEVDLVSLVGHKRMMPNANQGWGRR